jgi:hypothetical protein
LSEEVLFEGRYADGEWKVAGVETSRGLLTRLIASRNGEVVSTVGMSGPVLAAGSRLNVATGSTVGGPLLVLARCHPDVQTLQLLAIGAPAKTLELSNQLTYGVKIGVSIEAPDTMLESLTAFDRQGHRLEIQDLLLHNESVRPLGDGPGPGRGGWHAS